MVYLLLLKIVFLFLKKDNNDSQSLASKVNERIRLFQSGQVTAQPQDRKKAREAKHSQTPSEELSKRVSTKKEAFDIKGAIRVASSDEQMADSSDVSVANELEEKHPPPSFCAI